MDTVNDRAPHEFLDLCSVNSSLFAERTFVRLTFGPNA